MSTFTQTVTKEVYARQKRIISQLEENIALLQKNESGVTDDLYLADQERQLHTARNALNFMKIKDDVDKPVVAKGSKTNETTQLAEALEKLKIRLTKAKKENDKEAVDVLLEAIESKQRKIKKLKSKGGDTSDSDSDVGSKPKKRTAKKKDTKQEYKKLQAEVQSMKKQRSEMDGQIRVKCSRLQELQSQGSAFDEEEDEGEPEEKSASAQLDTYLKRGQGEHDQLAKHMSMRRAGFQREHGTTPTGAVFKPTGEHRIGVDE